MPGRAVFLEPSDSVLLLPSSLAMTLSPSIFLALASSFGPGPLPPHDLLFEIDASSGFNFGVPLCRLQDIDGDTYPDFAALVRGQAGGSEVRILSGRDGSWIRSIWDPDAYFGQSLADAGDVDGDGVGDLIAGGSYDVRVCSGATGGTLFQFHAPSNSYRYGYSVAGVGDVDGDGVPDLAVGDPQRMVSGGGDHYTMSTNGPGYVEIRSGANGSLLRTLHGVGSGIAFGGRVIPTMDADGDGVGDIAVAGYLEPLPMGPTSLTLFSGATGAVLWEIPIGGMGGVIASLGDIDQDGRGDVLVGNPGMSRVMAVSGADGSTLWFRDARMELWRGADRFGCSVAVTGDLDGDGIRDVLVGASQPAVYGFGYYYVGPGYVRVLSGRDGRCLSSIVGDSFWSGFGRSVCAIGDIDHDGRLEMIVASPLANSLGVYSGDERNSTPQSYCIPGANSAAMEARIGWGGTYSLAADDFVLTVQGAMPDRPGVFVASANASALRLDLYSGPDHEFDCLGAPPHYTIGTVVATNPGGAARCRFDASLLPAGAVTPGSTWNFQFVYRDPAGSGYRVNRSDAISVTFRP